MGKKIAPATKNPHAILLKQKKMCVSQAATQAKPNNHPISFLRGDVDVFNSLKALIKDIRYSCHAMGCNKES